MKLVYIAHPLYGDGSLVWGNKDRNVERYLRFAAMATNQGEVVVSWVHHYLLEQRALTPPGDHDFYLRRDARLLRACDELWVCGPPEVSSGVRFEIDVAKQAGILTISPPEWQDFNYFMKVTS